MKVKLDSFLQEIRDKTTDNDQYPVLTSSKAGLFLQSDYFNKQVASKDNTGYKIIRRGQFTYRAMSDTGEFFPNMLECTDIGIVSPAYPVFEITNPEIVLPEFLKYFFKSDSFQHAIATFAQGSTRTSVKFGKLKSVFINLPSIAEQYRIVEVLDRSKAIIAGREEELKKLDNLIKARFVEMFGDPVANDMGWDTLPLENVCKAIVDCPHSTPSYTNEDTGFMCIRTSIVKKNKILWDDIEYISEDEFAKRIQRKKPEVGDIVYTREGAILGIAAIIDRDCNVALGQRSMLLSPDIDKCTSEFLCVAMNSDSFLDNALRGVSGSASPHINVGDIKAFKMIMPPIELQEQFSDFVKQVDKSKVVELIVKNMSLLLHSGLDILIIREVMR